MSKENKQPDTIIVRAIVKHNGKILVLRRSDANERAGDWEFPGGHLDPGETLEQGIRRETIEETGLDLKHYVFEKSTSYKHNDSVRLGVIFEVHSDSDEVKLSNEHDKYEWIDADNYNNIEFNDVYLKYLEEFFKTEADSHNSESISAKSTTKVKHLIIYTDGGSRGNPGPSASGYVIMTEDEKVLEEGGEYLGITTNNQAEYQAVKLALQAAQKYQPEEIDFYIDSLLVVNQMNGSYKIKNRDLWPIHEDIKKQASQYNRVEFTHVRREFNSLADSKVNEVLDSYNHREGS